MEHQDLLELLVLQELAVQQVLPEHQELMDLQDHQELVELQDLPERQV